MARNGIAREAPAEFLRICDEIARIEAQIATDPPDAATLQENREGLMAELKRLLSGQPSAPAQTADRDGSKDDRDDLFDDVPV